MIKILMDLFINKEDKSSPYYKGKVAMICSIVGIFLNILLFGVKYYIGVASGSVSITADAFNNITDAGTSFAMMIGVKVASFGRGEHHPAGHGRFEWIISIMMAFLVINVGLKLLVSSFGDLGHQNHITVNTPMLIIMLLSIGVKAYMYLFNNKYGRKIDSETMIAVAKDSISDAVATGMVLLSVIISHFFGINIDGYCGILVSGFIIYNGFSSLSETAGRILGSSPPRSELMKIKRIILEDSFFSDVLELRIEDYGMGKENVMIKAGYIEDRNATELQKKIEQVSIKLYESKQYETQLMPVKIIVNKTTAILEKKISKLVKSIIPFAYIEHFHMVEAQEGKHIYLDVVIPKSQEKTEFKMTLAIEKAIKEEDPKNKVFPQYHIFADIRKKPWINGSLTKKYDGYMEKIMFPKNFDGSLQKHHEILKDMLANVKEKKVLDIACGSGDAVYYLNNDNDYLGIDISASFLDIAKEKLVKAGFTKFNCMEGNAYAIPLPDDSIDVVICNLALQMMEPSIPFLMEVKRILKQDGLFVGSLPVTDFGKQKFRYNRDVSTSTKVKDLLEDKGFNAEIFSKVNGAICYFSAQKYNITYHHIHSFG